MTFRDSLLAISLLILFANVPQAQITVHYINVGQAESILREFKTVAILIDAGGEDTGDDRDVDHLISYLNDSFTRRTDLKRTLYSVIVSHPHIDHTGHLPAIFDKANKFKVLNLVDRRQRETRSGYSRSTGPARSLRRTAFSGTSSRTQRWGKWLHAFSPPRAQSF